MNEKSTDSEHETLHEENERCFLPDKEKIKYHSIIIYEFFNSEDFDTLIK